MAESKAKQEQAKEEVEKYDGTLETAQTSEAPNSCNFRWQHAEGWVVQWTMRHSDTDILLDNLLSLFEVLASMGCKPAPLYQRPPGNGGGSGASSQKPKNTDPAFCPIHEVTMKKFEKGGRTWYAHSNDDGEWCNPQNRKAQGF